MLAPLRSWRLCLAVALIASQMSCSSGSPVLASPVHLGQLYMFASGRGWAFGLDVQHNTAINVLLRTADGGRHWRNVTPVNGPPQASRPAVLDEDHAWLARFARPGQVSVFRTSDGGGHWRESLVNDSKLTVPDSLVDSHIMFIDRSHGWLLLQYGYGGDDQVSLYGTSDGGASWAVISNTDPLLGDGNAIPWQGSKTGITFADVENGWLTAFSYRPKPLLYATHDGGITWMPVLYPDAPGVRPSQVISPTHFFTRTTGYFVIGGEQSLLFWTTDSGGTWTPEVVPTCCDVDFIDPNTGWALGYTYSTDQSNADLWRTDDGGRHWRTEHHAMNAQSPDEVRQHFVTRLYSLDFASRKVGYLVRESRPVSLLADVTASPSPPSGSSRLLTTVDGGATWSEVPYQVEL